MCTGRNYWLMAYNIIKECLPSYANIIYLSIVIRSIKSLATNAFHHVVYNKMSVKYFYFL